MVETVPAAIGGLFVLLGLAVLLGGVGRIRSWLTLRGMSAGAVTGTGMVEVEGTAQSLQETLDPPRANVDSLAYEYERKERHHDPDPDDPGNEWRTVESVEESVPFVVEGTSEVVVDPDGADFTFEKNTDRGGGTKHISARLDVGEPVYVAGTAVQAHEADIQTDGQKYVVSDGGAMIGGQFSGLFGSPFVVSDSGEETAENRLRNRGILQAVLGVVITGIGSVFLAIGFGIMG